MNFEYDNKKNTKFLSESDHVNNRKLVIFNDDFNTFDHVIDTLVKICSHTPLQAQQCAWFIHYKGKYTVKTGLYSTLKPIKDAICEKGLDGRLV